MSEHNRRERYWQYYELAREAEASHMRKMLIGVVRDMPCPRPDVGGRGRPPIRSKEKMDFACLLMMADNNTYRGIESDLREMRTPWGGEPIPDHTTLVRHLQGIPGNWMGAVLTETARRCIGEALLNLGDLRRPLFKK